MASLPFLMKLYGPLGYGYYSLYASIMMFAGMIVCLRYDVALPVIKNKKELIGAVSVSIYFIGLFFILLSIVSVSLYVRNNENFVYSLSISFGVLFVGLNNICNSLILRYSMYNKLSIVKTFFGLFSALYSFIFYKIFDVKYGLICANIAAYASCFVIGVFFLMREINFNNLFSSKYVWFAFLKHKEFALYNVPQAISDGLRPIAIASLISNYYGSVFLGIYHIANQLLTTISNVVIQPSSQLFYKLLYEKNTKDILDFKSKYEKIIFVGGFCFILLLFFVAAFEEEYFYSEKWVGLPVDLIIMFPIVFFNLILAPFVNIFYVHKMQKYFMMVGLSYNIIAAFGLAASIYFGVKFFAALFCYSICGSVGLLYIKYVTNNVIKSKCS